jgi:hypothetical protein
MIVNLKEIHKYSRREIAGNLMDVSKTNDPYNSSFISRRTLFQTATILKRQRPSIGDSGPEWRRKMFWRRLV